MFGSGTKRYWRYAAALTLVTLSYGGCSGEFVGEAVRPEGAADEVAAEKAVEAPPQRTTEPAAAKVEAAGTDRPGNTAGEEVPEKAELAPTKPIDITADSFDDAVKEGIVLVDFWAPWCGWCKKQTPILEKLAAEYAGKVKIVKLNTDDHPSVAQRLGVKGLPTTMLFGRGRRLGKYEGYRPESFFRTVFDMVIEVNANLKT